MTLLDVGTPPDGFQGWESNHIRFHGFASLPSARGADIKSPMFTCFGHQWQLQIYPGGRDDSQNGMVSVFLHHLSDESMKILFNLRVTNANDQTVAPARPADAENMFGVSTGTDVNQTWGWVDFANHFSIHDLVGGTLVIEIRMKLIEPTNSLSFIPKNPFYNTMLKVFMDKETADVVFEVDDGEQEQQGRKSRSKSPKKSHVKFHAHRLILQKCSPDLAALCGSSGEVPISDVKPEIFRYLLSYVYGGKVSDDVLKTHFKDIIDAADRYGIVLLKLEAEAWYAKETTIEVDTMMEHLLYADAKNCALLKEAVMDFIIENGVEILEKVSLQDLSEVSGPDLLTAMSRGKKKSGSAGGDQFSTMRVSELRKRLEEKGLDVDGSRETMIATLRNNA